jgi:hypothetical protein
LTIAPRSRFVAAINLARYLELLLETPDSGRSFEAELIPF